MIFVYPAIFHQEDSSYWVEFPDLPGCQSFGDTLSETMAEAQEALAAYVLTLLEQGKPLAQPSDIGAITPEDGFTSLVACTIDQYKETGFLSSFKKRCYRPRQQAPVPGILLGQQLISHLTQEPQVGAGQAAAPQLVALTANQNVLDGGVHVYQ